MGNDLKTAVVIDLEGNLVRKTQRFDKAMAGFSRNGQRHMGRLSRSAAAAGRMLDRAGNRYTALLTGAAATASARSIIRLDARLEQMGVNADISSKKVAKIKQELMAIANDKDIRVDPADLLAGVEEIIARTGNLDLALENMRNIALTMRATGAAGQDSGALVANFFEKFQIKDAKGLLETLDTAAILGKEGAFELRDLATEGNAVSAAYAMTGRTGKIAAREMLAMLQIIRRTTPSAAEASTAFERMIATLVSEKATDLQNAGIQIWDPDRLKKDGRKVARAIPDIIEDILVKSNADPEILAKIFDVRALRAVNAFALEFAETGRLQSMERFLEIQGNGNTLMADSARNAKTADAALTGLHSAWKRLADENLSGPIQGLADGINSIDKDTFDTGVKTVIGGGAALLAGRQLFKGGKAVKDFFGKNKAVSKAVGAFGSGVQPVYVVNMPGSGVPGLGGPGGKNARVPKTVSKLKSSAALLGGTKLGKLGTLGTGAVAAAGGAVGAAGLAGYGAGSLIHEYGIKDTEADTVIGRTMANVLAAFGNEEAKRALEQQRREDARAKLEIEVTDSRVNVKGLESQGFDMSVDTGEIMVSP